MDSTKEDNIKSIPNMVEDENNAGNDEARRSECETETQETEKPAAAKKVDSDLIRTTEETLEANVVEHKKDKAMAAQVCNESSDTSSSSTQAKAKKPEEGKQYKNDETSLETTEREDNGHIAKGESPSVRDDDEDSLLRRFRDELSQLPPTRTGTERSSTRASVPGAFNVSTPFSSRSFDEDDAATVTYEIGGSQDEGPQPEAPTLTPINSGQPLAASVYDGSSPGYRLQEHQQQEAAHIPDLESQLVATKIVPDEGESIFSTKLPGMGFLLILLLIVVLMSLGLAGVFPSADLSHSDDSTVLINDDREEQPESLAFPSLLEEIRHRGYMTCFYLPIQGLLYRDETTDEVSGFNAAWCEAIAAGIFGAANATTLKYVDYIPYKTNVNIPNNTADANAWGMPPFMNRHIHSPLDHTGRFFSTPFYFYGLYVAGDSFHVHHCIQDNGFKHVEECKDLKVCYSRGLQQEALLRRYLPERRLVQSMSFADTVKYMANGTCNAHMLVSQRKTIPLQTLGDAGYQGDDYVAGDKFYGGISMSIVTRNGDPRWADFVNAIFHSLLSAAQHEIGQSSAHEMPQTDVFGEDYKDMFRNAVKAVGNYGELYERYLGSNWTTQGGMNRINNSTGRDNATTGLLYSLPLGDLPDIPVDRPLGSHLGRILQRGRLHCGVRLDRPGFAASLNDANSSLDTATGMDIDYCRAIAASLFDGNSDALDLVAVTNQSDGFRKLAITGEIDVLAGATWNLANEVKEPTTGVGFAFSQPYFYGYSKAEDNLCLATLEDDHDWFTFVYWTVAATIYAEEKGIRQATHYEMPSILSYGEVLGRMFRDAIFSVGNYGEMYERNLQELIPRGGRNMLNSYPHQDPPGPQHYPMPGIIV